ncbi:hypothetical protein HL653_21370 [Sphingomonas sp. AP4-R1]|uniref:hypothetical protein n=1 Tax=Sphingomonas sp. AP4-R1 TaxID=2735134 RepID=UPI001493CD91|nr:hypothetical protein [Sphingomonas sp. AP4-R1]QJU59954.1 hypothetical protein HL653_21370 [Sphingomonas sp. AP4-R1]
MRFGISEALIRCVSNGLSASDREIDALASRIWTESAPFRSALAWTMLEISSSERLTALRAATIALNGYVVERPPASAARKA